MTPQCHVTSCPIPTLHCLLRSLSRDTSEALRPYLPAPDAQHTHKQVFPGGMGPITLGIRLPSYGSFWGNGPLERWVVVLRVLTDSNAFQMYV